MASYTEAVTDGAGATGLAGVNHYESVEDVAGNADILSSFPYWYRQLVDVVGADDAATITVTIFIADALGADDAAAASNHSYPTLSDEAGNADSVTPWTSMLTSITDGAGSADSLAAQLVLNVALADAVGATAILQLGDIEYEVMVMNTKNLARSLYTSYNFNSMAEFRDAYYGAKDDGIYLLDGDTDAAANISATIKTGITDYGVGNMKRVEYAILGVSNADTLVLKTITYDRTNGQEIERWYNLLSTNDRLRNVRVKFNRKLKSNYWQFELANKDGGDFELDFMEVYPLILKRRV